MRHLKFGDDNAFQLELRRRVEEYFRTTGRRQRDCWQMYVKTAILLAGFAGSYLLLVFVAQTWWQGLLLAILLGLSAAGIGFKMAKRSPALSPSPSAAQAMTDQIAACVYCPPFSRTPGR